MTLEEKIIRAVEQSYEGFLLADTKGKIFYANPAVSRISGEDLSRIVGHTIKSMIRKGVLEVSTKNITNKDHITFLQRTITGKEVFITSKPVYDDNGEILYYVANYRDLSTLNKLFDQHIKATVLKEEELERYRDRQRKTGDIISISKSMNELKEKIEKIAATDATVLIIGETGTGKELIAKTIHNLSSRNQHAYITINCGAIPENLFESELFGYEKGAFSGANSSKPGLLEIANNGTVLLDEIGEMPLHLQVKLLRTIQTNEIMRVGGTTKKQLNVRYIAATNRDLGEMVAQNKFREDLYYRLNVVQLIVPPLRERKEDIRLLAKYFLNRYKKKYKKHVYFSNSILQVLENYHWPGNVRQLENLVEQLVILADEEIITEESLPHDIVKDQHFEYNDEPLDDILSKVEKNVIKQALSKYKSIRKAAKALGISHPTLLRKMEKYQLFKPSER